MKKNKNIKLALNKQTIAKLDSYALQGIQGGKEQSQSWVVCSKTPSCLNACDRTQVLCDIIIIVK